MAAGSLGESRASPIPRAAGLKMTTAAPVSEHFLSLTNVTTKSREEILYQSSGAIVAAIVVGVVLIFTTILLILKTYNRRMRTKRELEPKNVKSTVPSVLSQESSGVSPGHSMAVRFDPVELDVVGRRP